MNGICLVNFEERIQRLKFRLFSHGIPWILSVVSSLYEKVYIWRIFCAEGFMWRATC